MKNIVLIGMPACGKVQIGYWLSKKNWLSTFWIQINIWKKRKIVLFQTFSQMRGKNIFEILN